MSNTDKLSMSRFIRQYLLPLFTVALILVLLSYFNGVRAANAGTDAGKNFTVVSGAEEVGNTELALDCD